MRITEPDATGENVLVLLPDRDSPPRRDFVGAFLPAANLMERHLRATVHQIEVPTVDPIRLTITAASKQQIYEQAARDVCEIVEQGGWTRIVFCCHGWSQGLQLGLRTSKERGADVGNWTRFVAALRACTGLRSITLFACSAGDAPGSTKSAHGNGVGSLAAELAHLAAVPVLAHTSAGHATRNPDLIHFTADGTGEVPFERGTPAYRASCRNLLVRKSPSGKAVPPPPPAGHTRPAWCSLVLTSSVEAVRDVLLSEPG